MSMVHMKRHGIYVIVIQTGIILHLELVLSGYGKDSRDNTECLNSLEIQMEQFQQPVQEIGLIQ